MIYELAINDDDKPLTVSKSGMPDHPLLNTNHQIRAETFGLVWRAIYLGQRSVFLGSGHSIPRDTTRELLGKFLAHYDAHCRFVRNRRTGPEPKKLHLLAKVAYSAERARFLVTVCDWSEKREGGEVDTELRLRRRAPWEREDDDEWDLEAVVTVREDGRCAPRVKSNWGRALMPKGSS